MDLTKGGKEVVFIWVPGHVGIRGNSAADSAAKDALVGDIWVELIPFSDLKPHTNFDLWQLEWDEFPENIVHKIFLDLKQCITSPQTKKRGNYVDRGCTLAILLLLIPLYRRVRNSQCASDVMNF